MNGDFFCHSLGKARFGSTELPSETLEAYNACRLIPLDKNPGVKPIGEGEVLRRMIGRSILKYLLNDLKQVPCSTLMDSTML